MSGQTSPPPHGPEADPSQPPPPHGVGWRALARWVPAPRWLSQRLYVRIWLTVVSVVAILALLAGWLWRLDMERERAERPGREIVVLNAAGDVVGQAPARPMRGPGPGHLEFRVAMRDGQTLTVQLPRPHRPPNGALSWWRSSGIGFAEMLLFLAVGVAAGTYPVVRWLTQRLEHLQHGVERWGDGDLSARLPVQGHDEVAFLAQRFNVAAERVQALWRAHQVLLANASHELRSPLARIRVGLELLDHPDPVKRAAQRAEVARNIAELDQLVDEILLASRLDAGNAPALQRESIDLTGLAAEECARTGAELQVLAQPTVWADARLLRRVLRNLLENAQRHGAAERAINGGSQEGHGVQLTVDQTRVNGAEHAQIMVDDHGPGVPPHLRGKVFDPFYRLPGASEREGGVGLGLALVQSIVRQHGGTVVCTERPGGGARFVVCLPVQPPVS